MSGTVKRLIIVVAVLAILFIGLRIWAKIFPEWLWFSSESINLSSVFWTVLKTKLGLGIGFGLLFLALALGNAFLLWKFALRKMADEDVMSVGGAEIPLGRRLFVGVVIFLCLFGAIIAGLLAVTQWEPYLRYARSDGITFSQQDPIFENDIAYYIFRMPFLRFLRGWFFGASLVLTAATGLIYSLLGGQEGMGTRGRFSMPMRAHLFTLGSIALCLLAWGRVFAKYELLAPGLGVRHGWVYGVGYTDELIRIPVQNIMMGIAIISAVLLFISIFARGMTRVALGGIALYVAVVIIGGLMVPWAIQRLRVDPQELDKEEKYIKHNIDYTRRAYNLNNIAEESYKGTGELTLEDITQNRAVMENIRLWDWRPLRDTFKQLEARRPQYDFVDVDIDRYVVDGRTRQVMLSARELIFSKVENRSWVNRTFVYTHGHGVTVIPVSEIEQEGLPRMYVNDIPPKVHAPWDQSIDQPEIYYGEGERTGFRSEMGRLPYIIVDPQASDPDEFDYPGLEEDALTSYSGIGGVPLTGFWRRLAYAFKFSSDMRNILFSGEITSTSRILFHRSISERVRAIAPFLKYDPDPYLVISKGRLYWIQDAYTTTHMYPYSEPTIQEMTEVMELGRQRFPRRRQNRAWGNYIRNSVKVVIDAYDGTVKYYTMTGEEGQADPIAECYDKMFPDLFTDFREMDPDLKQHIRYPLTLFLIQAEKYTRYHMKEPRQFYRKEDVWQVSTEKYQTLGGESSGEQPVEPYYVILQLPNSDKEEFMLMLPFTPAGKKNMRAWLAAKCDPGENGDMGEYGNLMVYTLPKGELIDGTIQIEAYIDQNEEMSGQLSLWSQLGSSVIRGNLLAIPIKDSMMYVEPIYLQAEEAAIPQLKRVVVALDRTRLEWGTNLENALEALYGKRPPPEAVVDTDVQPVETLTGSESARELSGQALEHINNAEKYLRNGEWAKYGEELDRLKETLEALQGTEEQ
jgi:uncharacterized membrane protein (UPF0182 family)